MSGLIDNSSIIGKKAPDEYLVEDFIDESLKNYDTFVASKSTDKDALYDSYYEDGFMSEVEQPEDLEISDLNIYASDELKDGLSNIANDNLIVLSSDYIDIECPIINEDVRYSNLISGANSVFVNNKYSSIVDYRALIDNFYKKSNYKSTLYVNPNDFGFLVKKYAEIKGLSCEDVSSSKLLKISKDMSNNLYGAILKSGANEYKFICDVANTYEKKVMGLQNRDYLSKKQGMIFTYDRPTDVSFHMGTVSFPIDILFIDEENIVKKISSNIQPQTAGIFSCSQVKYVLEIPGGFCEANKVKEGDFLFANSLNNLNEDFVKKSYNLSVNQKNKDNQYNNVIAINLESFIDFEKTYVASKGSLVKSASYVSSASPQPTSIVAKTIYSDFELSNFLKDSWHNGVVFYSDKSFDESKIKNLLKQAFDQKDIDLNFEVITASKDEFGMFDKTKLSGFIFDSFGATDISFVSDNILKEAGIAVPKSTKQVALSADKKCLIISKKIKRIKLDLEKNQIVLEKLKDNPKAIEGSSGQLQDSFSRIKKKYVYCLEEIKKVYIEMDKIKDVSSTLEVLNSFLLSTKNSSKILKELFEMPQKTKSIDFLVEYKKRTENATKVLDDLLNNNKRVRDYIYSEILGKTILSE
jgi:uncharacterized membrane protein (UPF0127 family)